MILKLPVEIYDWFVANPMVWWSPEARSAFGKVAPGVPAVELDENEDPTGFVIMSHPNIDHKDQYIAEVCAAGIAYLETLPEAERQGVFDFQAQTDYNNLLALKALLDNGDVTLDDAYDVIWNEILRQGQVLGVEYVEPVIEEDLV